MIHIDRKLIQGSEEWFDARLGHATASHAKKILTAKTLELSKSSVPYMHSILAQRVLQEAEDGAEVGSTLWMDRGVAHEVDARRTYEFENDVKCETVGIIYNDELNASCSPDSLVGDDGMIEIKCPMLKNQIGYYLAGTIPSEYLPQIHASLAIAERDWLDVFLYHPHSPPLQVRVNANDHTAAMRRALISFADVLEQAWAKIAPQLGDECAGSLLRWPIANPAPEPEPPIPTAATDATGAGAASDDPYDW